METKCVGGKPILRMWGFRCRQNHSSMLLSDFVTLFCKISCFESIIFSSKLPSAKFSFRFLFFDLLKISIKIFYKKNYNNLIDNFNNFFTIISFRRDRNNESLSFVMMRNGTRASYGRKLGNSYFSSFKRVKILHF